MGTGIRHHQRADCRDPLPAACWFPHESHHPWSPIPPGTTARPPSPALYWKGCLLSCSGCRSKGTTSSCGPCHSHQPHHRLASIHKRHCGGRASQPAHNRWLVRALQDQRQCCPTVSLHVMCWSACHNSTPLKWPDTRAKFSAKVNPLDNPKRHTQLMLPGSKGSHLPGLGHHWRYLVEVGQATIGGILLRTTTMSSGHYSTGMEHGTEAGP